MELNRRNFIKTLGAAVAYVLVPSAAGAVLLQEEWRMEAVEVLEMLPHLVMQYPPDTVIVRGMLVSPSGRKLCWRSSVSTNPVWRHESFTSDVERALKCAAKRQGLSIERIDWGGQTKYLPWNLERYQV